MNEEEVEEGIKEILAIVEKVPEKFQVKCFEILLSNFLTSKHPIVPSIKEEKEEAIIEKEEFVIEIDVRAFLQQYDVPEENLESLFLMQGNDVRDTYKIKTTKKSRAQIQIALLTALENALKTGNFEFNIEDIRQRCKNHRCYDAPNFRANFRKNTNLFKNLDDEEHTELSPDGKAELAETILEILNEKK